MKEIWKDIKGFEGRYKVSNLGKIFSINKNITLKPLLNSFTGYTQVSLYYDKKKSTKYYIHQTVLSSFELKKHSKIQINHKNGNKEDNRLSNLEWCNGNENQQHRREKLENKKRGVIWNKQCKKWQARLTTKNKQIHLGVFESKEYAYKAFYDYYTIYYNKVPWTIK